MAKRIVVSLVDDLDGGEADCTVTFGLDGTHYEIDLNRANSDRLTRELEPFIEKARKIKSPKTATGSTDVGDTAKIRAWAREEGVAVSDRGRIAAEVREAYRNRS